MALDTQFYVVVNTRGEYAIWPDFQTVPAGWSIEGFAGSEADCVKYIDQSQDVASGSNA